MKEFIKKTFAGLGYDVRKKDRTYADPSTFQKGLTFVERYREIISDPLNISIERDPQAGFVDKNGNVILHNGNRVPISGDLAYYEDFSDILIINRGVHEPLEEFCFQRLLSKLKDQSPTMIELGAYWAHYSMWLKKVFPSAKCYMVEPDANNLKCGQNNFSINGYKGEFINAFVGPEGFQLDEFTQKNNIEKLDILHSDIQGYETEMLKGAKAFLSKQGADHIFISTHSEEIHAEIIKELTGYGYRIEVSSPYNEHTTSGDGFVLATSPKVDPLFNGFIPLGRIEIAKASAAQLVQSIIASQK